MTISNKSISFVDVQRFFAFGETNQYIISKISFPIYHFQESVRNLKKYVVQKAVYSVSAYLVYQLA